MNKIGMVGEGRKGEGRRDEVKGKEEGNRKMRKAYE